MIDTHGLIIRIKYIITNCMLRWYPDAVNPFHIHSPSDSSGEPIGENREKLPERSSSAEALADEEPVESILG